MMKFNFMGLGNSDMKREILPRKLKDYHLFIFWMSVDDIKEDGDYG